MKKINKQAQINIPRQNNKESGETKQNANNLDKQTK